MGEWENGREGSRQGAVGRKRRKINGKQSNRTIEKPSRKKKILALALE
jgi:hypothetical protein